VIKREISRNIFQNSQIMMIGKVKILYFFFKVQRVNLFEFLVNNKGDYGMALCTFAQLIKHFGWDSMRLFMKNYEKDINDDDSSLPKSNQDKIDQWVIRFSKIVSRNIKPQFEMFGLPVSNHVDTTLHDLEKWCPLEEKDPDIFFSELN